MEPSAYYTGQRLSLKGQLCTVRYVGPVAEKPGDWLGVEWDDPERGKHDGSHDGVKYFECRNPSPTAASFLKLKQQWDQPRTFYQALREKYMPEDAGTGGEIVYFSSKKAEEVGFEKFAKRQAQLQGIHVIVLDHMRIHGKLEDSERTAITDTCSHLTELDLGSNLFESLDEIIELCALLPKLSRLTLDGNRFDAPSNPDRVLSGVRSISLSNTWLSWAAISSTMTRFPNTKELFASHNGFKHIGFEPLPNNISGIVLSENAFETLGDLKNLSRCKNLEEVVLKRSRISTVSAGNQPLSETVRSIDLSYNNIASWSFFDTLEDAYPRLKQLHVGGNPLHQDLCSVEGRPLTAEDGYMLTIARLPRLGSLNYSKITEKEILNAETYYLGQIALQLAIVPTNKADDVLREHPRWKALCEEYGEPNIPTTQKTAGPDLNSLAARLVTITFVLESRCLPALVTRTWTEDVPKSFSIYSLLGVTCKRVGIMPLKLRLIWETGERDPVGDDAGYTGPEWWDSSDEEDEPTCEHGDFQTRDGELVASTRSIGTYIEGREAHVRVEVKA